MNRRKFIKQSALGTVALGTFTGFYTWQLEPFWLEFVEKLMPIKNLPSHLDGKTLMQISDLHVGDKFDYQFIIDSLKKAQVYRPDIVAYTGDYVTWRGNRQFMQLDEVLKYTVRGKLGTVGILGNHDYGHRWEQQWVADGICERLKNNGIDILINEKIDINGLNFIGIDDFWGLHFEPKKATALYKTNEPTVVLCHNPDVCDMDVWNGYRGWILSGHTHGGQIKPPFLSEPLIPVKNKRYSKGEIDLYDGRRLYINRALGHTIQLRFNVRPEITIFKLVAI
jgi:predicted MPP superfamily phosphohydrolase